MPNPSKPWLRLWDCTLDLPKAQRLTGDQFKGWMNLLMLANRQNDRGRLPSAEEIAFALRISEAKVGPLIESLVKARLIDKRGSDLIMHDWATWQPPEKTNAQRAHEWREQQKTQALNGSAHRALEPSAPEESRGREEKEERENESARPPLEVAGLGPEFARVGELAMNMTGDLSWGAWVQQQALAGHSAADLEAAIKEASGVGKLGKGYTIKILQRWAIEGRPTNGKHDKLKPPEPSITPAQEAAAKKLMEDGYRKVEEMRARRAAERKPG